MHKSPDRKGLLIPQETVEVITWFNYLEEIWMLEVHMVLSHFLTASGNQKLQISVQQLWDLGVVPDIWAKWDASERHMGIKSKQEEMLFGPIRSLQTGSKHPCLWPKPLAHLGNRPFALCVSEKNENIYCLCCGRPFSPCLWTSIFGLHLLVDLSKLSVRQVLYELIKLLAVSED